MVDTLWLKEARTTELHKAAKSRRLNPFYVETHAKEALGYTDRRPMQLAQLYVSIEDCVWQKDVQGIGRINIVASQSCFDILRRIVAKIVIKPLIHEARCTSLDPAKIRSSNDYSLVKGQPVAGRRNTWLRWCRARLAGSWLHSMDVVQHLVCLAPFRGRSSPSSRDSYFNDRANKQSGIRSFHKTGDKY